MPIALASCRWTYHTTAKYIQLPPKLAVCLFLKMCGHFFWNQCQSSYNVGSNSFLLRDLLRRWAVWSSGEQGAGGSYSRPTAFTTLRDTKWCLLYWNQCSGEPDKHVCTCVLISSGMVFCWTQEWTSASSSLCSWLNQGWRGWSTWSLSLSFANTSLWSLDGPDTEQSNDIRKQQIKTKPILSTFANQIPITKFGMTGGICRLLYYTKKIIKSWQN